MREEKISLALAFLQSHPEPAAAILEQHEVQEVAAFLTEIPQSFAAPVIQYLLPHYAARLCNVVSKDIAVGILSSLELGQVAAILRYLNKSRRNEFLEVLPTKTQIACSLLLNYSNELVGAWITPQIATIPSDYLVQEALNYLKGTPDIVPTDFLFTVNRDRELKGRIRLVELLRARTEMQVSNLAEPNGATLTGRMRLSLAAAHADWKKFHEIPVLNRNQKFIGVLRHVDLRKGLDHLAPEVDPQSEPASLEGLVQAYGDSLKVLFDSMQHIIKSDFRN